MLSVRQMGVRVGERWTLQDVTFDIRRGEIVGIAGVEGNRQRELVDAIMGMRPPQQGSIHLGGEDITLWSSRRRREARIPYTPLFRPPRTPLRSSTLRSNT